MIDYKKIIDEEKSNADKIYLYPLRGMSGWIAYEASAEYLNGLLSNIPYRMKSVPIDSVANEIKAMVIDNFSLNAILEKVDAVNEPTRLVITLKEETASYLKFFCKN